ncbi:hypothetical protein AAC387_Pa02g3577 [Persea americana]
METVPSSVFRHKKTPSWDHTLGTYRLHQIIPFCNDGLHRFSRAILCFAMAPTSVNSEDRIYLWDLPLLLCGVHSTGSVSGGWHVLFCCSSSRDWITAHSSDPFVFGVDPGCLAVDFPTVPFAKAMDDAMEALLFRHVIPESWWMLLKWLNIGWEKKLAEGWKIIDQFINQHISTRREELHKSKAHGGESDREEGGDLLTAYINYQHEDGLGLSNSDKFLRDTAVNLMLAGRDTTSSALTWFFWVVSMNPEVETKILQELKATSPKLREGGHGIPKVFDAEELSQLVYLHAALCESLRLFPPVPFEHKSAVQPQVLPTGETIQSETKIVIPLYAMGRMESIWGKDCLEYKPERWISEREVETKILQELKATSPKLREGGHGIPKVFDAEELSQLVYLHAALCESLRLFPPVPFEHKSAVQPQVLPTGETIQSETKIVIPLYAMGRMESIWGKDCLEYKPERWISEKAKSDKFLGDTTLNLVLAGRDTTSSALTWFFWLVSLNPEVESKILEELRANSPELSDWQQGELKDFDSEEPSQLVYLHAALHESLRLFPPAPFGYKSALQPEVLLTGDAVQPGTKILIPLYTMARMEPIWGKDCLEFKPERWITERGKLKFEPYYKLDKFYCLIASTVVCDGGVGQ